MADDEAVQNDRRWRKLTFAEEVETVSLPTDSDSNRTNPKSTVRKAAQAWAKSKKLILGTWSDPKILC